MKRAAWIGSAIVAVAIVVYVCYVSVRIERQSVRDEAQPSDVILVLGAAEYRGRPSPVLRARLDHALELYQRQLAPRILTTGGAGGDPVYTEGGVGRSYLMGRGVPSESIIVENEGESTLASTALAGEIMQRMGLQLGDRGERRVPHLPGEEDDAVPGIEGVWVTTQGPQSRFSTGPLELCETGSRLCVVARGVRGVSEVLYSPRRRGERRGSAEKTKKSVCFVLVFSALSLRSP